MTPEKAWSEGTNVLASFRVNPAQTEATLLILLKETLSYLDCTKTITADRDFIHAVDFLKNEFPAMKLKEWHIICHRLKTGEYPVKYERLKLPEIVAIFRQYEGESRDEGKCMGRAQKGHPRHPNRRTNPTTLLKPCQAKARETERT